MQVFYGRKNTLKTRFYNARILKTKNHSFEVIRGELVVDGKTILSIKETNGSEGAFDNEINCEGNLLIPGFKNAHSHTAMVFLRSYADDLPLQDWLFKQVFPKEDQLTEENVYWFTVLGIMEYLTSGITTGFDMYYFPPVVAKAAADCGFRMVQTSGLNNFGGTVEAVEYNYNTVNELSDLTSFIIGFHGEYTTSMELMEGIAKLADKYKSPVFMHNSETKSEFKECFDRWDMSPTQITDSLGMYKYGGGGYHCVWCDEKDARIFREKGLYAVTCPASNLKLASGIAPLKYYLDNEVKIAIGTDGAASNNGLDFFREMYLAATLNKATFKDASAVHAEEILYAATHEGANAMGLTDCSCLEVGQKADIVMIDMNMPNMQPENNVVKNLVYSGSKSNVKMTMVNGKILYNDGKFDIGFDPKEVYAKTNAYIREMK